MCHTKNSGRFCHVSRSARLSLRRIYPAGPAGKERGPFIYPGWLSTRCGSFRFPWAILFNGFAVPPLRKCLTVLDEGEMHGRHETTSCGITPSV